MNILALETSCDETSAAVVKDGRVILSNIVLSQADVHALYGGVVPEIASRRHVEAISGVTAEAVKKAGLTVSDIDAIAATAAPGLIGALLVGLNFAKGLSFTAKKPFIPVHHIRAHIASNYLSSPGLEPPFLCLVVSGGHSLIVDVLDYTDMKIIGGTRDDAAGESFDKVARAMGLSYPGGAELDRLSHKGDAAKYCFPRANVAGAPFDFSFSGLKTAVINEIHKASQKGEKIDAESIAASFSEAVCDTLVPRLISAAHTLNRNKISVSGGVAINSRLRERLINDAEKACLKLFLPDASLCGDNAAMVGCQAYHEYLAGNLGKTSQNAYATLPVDENVCYLT